MARDSDWTRTNIFLVGRDAGAGWGGGGGGRCSGDQVSTTSNITMNMSCPGPGSWIECGWGRTNLLIHTNKETNIYILLTTTNPTCKISLLYLCVDVFENEE